MHLKKPSRELVFDLINQDNGDRFLPHHLQLGTPVPVDVNGRNTSLLVMGDDVDYGGDVTVRYNRLDLAIAMPALEPEGVEVMVPNDGFIDTGEISDRLNLMYDLELRPSDLVYQALSFDQYPASLTLNARPDSLAWIGSVDIQLVPDRPMFTDVITSEILNGFKAPELSSEDLTEPYVLYNQTLSVGETNALYYQPEGVSLPPTDFLVCSNDELVIAACPRVGNGVTSVPMDVDGYHIDLTENQSWVLVLSAEISTPPGTATKLTQAYDCTVDIVGPNGTTMSWKLVEREGVMVLRTLIGDTEHIVTTGVEINGGLSWQGLLDMQAIASLCPTVPLVNGVPQGSFLIRLQARRCNSLSPRLLASFVAEVG